MAGMLQIMTYMMAFYLVLKGVEILQIGMASSRPSRKGLITLGVLTLVACVLAAITFVGMQDEQAQSLSSSMNSATSYGAPY